MADPLVISLVLFCLLLCLIIVILLLEVRVLTSTIVAYSARSDRENSVRSAGGIEVSDG